jgi:NAD-dependent dihydropyrimidine dehydrogenase PreA subunit
VWCAADAGFFDSETIISALKTSGIAEKLSHKTLILPQLSAPSVDVRLIKKETGWTCKFGPVYSKDLPEYIKNNFEKSPEMRNLKFTLGDRLELALGILFFVFVLAPPIALLFMPALLVGKLFLLAIILLVLMYGFYYYIPGKSGLAKMITCEFIVILLYILNIFWLHQSLFDELFLWILLFVFLLGIDWDGISPLGRSKLNIILLKLGLERFGPKKHKAFNIERRDLLLGSKTLKFNSSKCNACGLCYEVCPKGVYKLVNSKLLINIENCIKCRACLMQCPTGAIFID